MEAPPFLTAGLSALDDAPPMNPIVVAAVSADGIGDLVVGIVLGLCLGLLVGPAIRSWQIRREWVEASREARLADRLLQRLEGDVEQDGAAGGPADAGRTDDLAVGQGREAWRTQR
jgi:hypothetical protein